MRRLLIAGAIGVAAGLLLHFTGICPVVKRIWTPSWTLFSGGVCFLFLAAFSWVIEVKGYRKWAFPLVVDRHELHCGLPDRAPVRSASSSIRSAFTWVRTFFAILGRRIAAAPAGIRRAAGVLADPVLDVQAQAVPAGLTAFWFFDTSEHTGSSTTGRAGVLRSG